MPLRSCVRGALAVAGLSLFACGSGNAGLNQTSITCSQGRTLLDGVCVSEQVADYVSCVRAQGAQLGAEKGQKLSAEVGTVGLRAGGAAELNETLQKKYAGSDQTMLAIVQACGAATGGLQPIAKTASGLSARWALDETSGTGVSDATGHGNTGVVRTWGPGTAVWVGGRIGGALKLDGSKDGGAWMEVDDAPSQHSSRAITMAGWFLLTKRDVGHPWRNLVTKTQHTGADWSGCANLPNCDDREYGAYVNADTRSLGIFAVTEDRYKNGGQTACDSSGGVVQYEKWHHFAGTVSPKSRAVRVFLDGAVLVTCPLSEAGLRRTSSKLFLAANWIGMVDDLRIYSDELTDSDIAELAKGKTPG